MPRPYLSCRESILSKVGIAICIQFCDRRLSSYPDLLSYQYFTHRPNKVEQYLVAASVSRHGLWIDAACKQGNAESSNLITR